MTSAQILEFRPVRARRGFGLDRGTLLAAALFVAVVLLEALLIATAAPVPIEMSISAMVT
jgi:hypothetical protein